MNNTATRLPGVRRQRSQHQAGFTLVEVMVALAVVAIALPALLVTLYQHVDATGYLRDKSMAQMVAANKLEELRILSHSGQSLLQGKDSGVSTMAGREWYWWLESQPTEANNFYRVEIDVGASEEEGETPLFTLIAFLSADLRADPGEGSGAGADPGAGEGLEGEGLEGE
jgi:general secretion pathway protein I